MSNNGQGISATAARRNILPSNLECPLASLGRNTRMETHASYHHPLSPSPLDPQVYQMTRESPDFSVEADDIIYTSVSQQGDDIININVGENDIDCLTSDSQTAHRTHANNYQEIFNLQSISNEAAIEQPPPLPVQQKAATFELRGRHNMNANNFPNTSSSSVGRYRQHKVPSQQTQFLALEQLLQSRRQEINGFLHTSAGENTADDFDNLSSDSQQRLQRNKGGRCSIPSVSSSSKQFYIENQMEALNLGSALRSLPIGSENNQFQNERFFIEDRLRNYNNNESLLLQHRASSPSETSGSDRYLLNRTNSPGAAFNASSQLDTFSSSNNNSSSSNLALDQRFHHSTVKSLTEGLCNLGRFSPSLDQGYATLVTPSPTGHNPNIITTHSIVHSHPTTNPTTNINPVTRLRPPPPWSKKGPLRSGPFFDRLSDDLITSVFSWLDSCDLCNVARVCRRFEQIAWRPTLWRIITLKGECLAGDKALKMIFRQLCGQSRNGSCPEVERVMLSDGCRISDKGLQLLTRRCPELTHLQLQSCVNITQQALVDVLTKCTNLQHLDVTGCLHITSINPNPNLEPPRRLLLQYLDLTDCMALDDVGLKTVVKNCPQLIYLYLRRCIQVTDAGLKFVPSFCISLKELSVSDCVNITDFGLYELAKLGAALRYLSVAKCDRVSDAGLKVIARRCYKLRYLNTRGCEAVSDDSITVLARSCPRLRALDIGKCDVSDAGLRALAESCPNLKKLSLRNCDMITDRGIQCIAYYCRGLQQLNIQDCQISIEGYRAVKKYCKRCIIEHTNPGFC